MTNWNDLLPYIPNLTHEHRTPEEIKGIVDAAEPPIQPEPEPEPEEKPRPKLVILESPYSGDVELNKDFLKACILDAISRGESPYASHQMLTEALDDDDPLARVVGMTAGFAWHEKADYVVVYTNLGVSAGMMRGIENATSIGKQVFFRELEVVPIEPTEHQ